MSLLCSIQFLFVRTFQELQRIFISMQTSFPRKLIVTPLNCVLLSIGKSPCIATLVVTLSLFCVFLSFFLCLNDVRPKHVTPSSLMRAIRIHNPTFRGYAQQVRGYYTSFF